MVAISARIFADYSIRTAAAASLQELTIPEIATISLLAGAPKARPT
jgi:hypothetical protein